MAADLTYPNTRLQHTHTHTFIKCCLSLSLAFAPTLCVYVWGCNTDYTFTNCNFNSNSNSNINLTKETFRGNVKINCLQFFIFSFCFYNLPWIYSCVSIYTYVCIYIVHVHVHMYMHSRVYFFLVIQLVCCTRYWVTGAPHSCPCNTLNMASSCCCWFCNEWKLC